MYIPTQSCIRKFELYIKRCGLIFESAEKIQKVKLQNFKKKKRKNDAFIKMRNIW